MKILSLQPNAVNANSVYMAFFMEGDMPTQTELDNLDINKVIEDCLISMPYICSQYMPGGKLIMQAANYSTQTTGVWPLHSSWQQVESPYVTQVLPKTRIPKNKVRIPGQGYPMAQIGFMWAVNAMPRIVGTALATPMYVGLGSAGSGNLSYSGIPVVGEENIYITSEYDFGADIELDGVQRIMDVASAQTASQATGQSAGKTNPTIGSSTINKGKLQALIEGVWTTVIDFPATTVSTAASAAVIVSTNGNEKVVARYFRVTAYSAVNGFISNALKFFGKYVNGNPRTFGKIGHMILIPWNVTTASGLTNVMNRFLLVDGTCNIMHSSESTRTIMDERRIAANAYSVTDDPKQIKNFDIFLPNGLDFEQGSNLFPPFFTTIIPVTEMTTS